MKEFIYIIVACSLLVVSCSKETVNKETNDNKETCLQFIGNATDLTIFKAALDRTGLTTDPEYLQNGPFTFFAPDDAAFKKVGLDLEAIRNYDKEALKKIIYGHVLAGRLGGGAAGGFYAIEALCLYKGYMPILSRNYYGLFLNGNASKASSDLGDGLVHKLSGVAFPGTVNLLQLIQGRPELSMFVALIEKNSDHGSPYLIDYKRLLTTGEPRLNWSNSTVICPTNEAFARLGYNTVADFDRLNESGKALMMSLHTTIGYSFTSEFIQNDWLLPGSDILRKGNSVILPRLLETNIKASNGVLHIIDQVILL